MEKNGPLIPNNAVVLLVGVAGSGKSTLAKRAFGNSALIVSSDECRKEISGSEENQNVNKEAFELFYKKIEEGVSSSKQVIADATNLDKFSRERIYEIAKKNNAPVYAIVFNYPIELIKKQNRNRNRVVQESVLDRMFEKMRIAYDQIREELPKENIIDIIPSKEQMEDLKKQDKGEGRE